MRQILQMVLEVAHEINKEAYGTKPEILNTKMLEIREAYGVVDQLLSTPQQVSPQIAREAMTIADFPLYFGQAISRAFYAEYAMKPASYGEFTFLDEVPDFRDVDRLRTDEFDTLVLREELGQAKAAIITETQIQYKVNEFARGFSISWRTLVNDDMGEIRTFPHKLMRAAQRHEWSFISNLYDNATSQAGLNALGTDFGDSLNIDVAGLKSAYEKFLNRTDAKGNPLLVTPRFVVTHPIHELTMREILAGFDPAGTNALMPRVTQGLLQWRPDPYIATTTDWYLFADPSDIPAVTVARLRGYPRPTVYLKAPDMVPFSGAGSLGSPSWLTGDFENGEIEFMVLNIIGGWDDATFEGVTDFRGIFYAHA